MEKFALPKPSEFTSTTGSVPDWMRFDSILIQIGATERDRWGFHGRMLELVGHKSTGSVPEAEVRSKCYSQLIQVWNSFEKKPNAEEFEAALIKNLNI